MCLSPLPWETTFPSILFLPAAKITGECQGQVSDCYSEAEQISSEESTWDESSETAAAAAILDPLDVSQEGDLTQFLMDTFDNTETTLDDLIEF